MRIAILGRGAYGTALGGILEKNRNEVSYYDVKDGGTLAEALEGAEAIIMAVPSAAVGELLPELPRELPLVIATKGILSLADFAEFEDVTALSGAGFADDLKVEKPTKLTFSDLWVSTWFIQPWIEFEVTEDTAGVLMCGALKNVYAIAAGMRGIERDTVEWAEFIGKALSEMREILMLNGAEAETVDLSCGRADLELTCGLPSRNCEFGMKVVADAGYQPENTVEGLTTLRKIKAGGIELPEGADILRELLEETWV